MNVQLRLSVGSIVWLKSGSPELKIKKLLRGGQEVLAEWRCHDGTLREGNFTSACLSPIPANSI